MVFCYGSMSRLRHRLTQRVQLETTAFPRTEEGGGIAKAQGLEPSEGGRCPLEVGMAEIQPIREKWGETPGFFLPPVLQPSSRTSH